MANAASPPSQAPERESSADFLKGWRAVRDLARDVLDRLDPALLIDREQREDNAAKRAADRGYRDDLARGLNGQPAVDSPSRYHDTFAKTAISLIDRGTAPWMHNDLRCSEVQPRNAVTGQAYTGANSVYLASRGTHRGFEDNRWLTRDQIEKAGGHRPIGPGERVLVRDDSNHQEPASHTSVVYNVEQVPSLEFGLGEARGEWESLRKARAVVLASEVTLLTSPSGKQSYYNAQHDTVVVPRHFRSPEHYFSTVFRNLAHASGHESRMNRATFREAHRDGHGSLAHAREMLRVEIAAMTLCNRLGGDYKPSSDSTNPKLWIQALKEDPCEMHRAASEGERIARHLMRPARDQLRDIAREARTAVQASTERDPHEIPNPRPALQRQAPAMSPGR